MKKMLCIILKIALLVQLAVVSVLNPVYAEVAVAGTWELGIAELPEGAVNSISADVKRSGTSSMYVKVPAKAHTGNAEKTFYDRRYSSYCCDDK